MPFCTSCSAAMEPTAQVCPSCGKAVGGTAPAAAASAPPPQKSGGGALKVVLLVLGGFVLLGILAVGVAALFIFRMAKDTRVEQTSGGAKVETPYGTMEANNEDSANLAAKMGVEVYPGARPLPGGASVNLGGMRTATVMFESDDPPEKLEEFYRKQFPAANVSSLRDEGGTHTVLMVGDREKWTTITIEGHEGGSKFTIASVDGGGK